MRFLFMVALVLTGCGSPELKDAIGQDCRSTECPDGSECIGGKPPEPEIYTCEVKCLTDLDCPERFHCNLPPVIVDSIPNICVDF